MYKTGLAPVTLDFTTDASNEAAALANAYIALNGTDESPANFEDYKTWYSNLQVVFHDTLQSDGNYEKLNIAILTKIDADFNVTGTVDPEVR